MWTDSHRKTTLMLSSVVEWCNSLWLVCCGWGCGRAGEALVQIAHDSFRGDSSIVAYFFGSPRSIGRVGSGVRRFRCR